MSDDRVRDAGFDEWLDAAEEGEATYLECPAEHGSLPPRRVCPKCGSTDLVEKDLSDIGEIETYTVTHVPTPAFEQDAPYVTAIADFGPVRLTGQVVDSDLEAIESGLKVSINITVSEVTSDRVIGFEIV